MVKITHLTSAHPRYDVRIFVKECSSLAKNKEYAVTLVVADGKGDEVKNGVHILDVGAKEGGRVARMTKTVHKVFLKAKELDSDIYHLHDPELLPIGLKLKRLGKRVIFDAHEDLPKQILGKPYLNRYSKLLLSKVSALFEQYACRQFDYIIAATPYIRDKFLNINPKSLDINNFPILEEFTQERAWSQKNNEVCYVGGISKVRGIKEIIKAMELVGDIRLNLAGLFNDKELEREVKGYMGWQKVNELGFIDRAEIAAIYSRSKVGLVTLHPIVNYLDALPIKMFEYMAAGLPLVASSFPLWREIVERSRCGICVDPLNPKEIANAIEYLLAHPKEAEAMGQNGKRAVLKQYNWHNEEAKLLKLYQEVIDQGRGKI